MQILTMKCVPCHSICSRPFLFCQFSYYLLVTLSRHTRAMETTDRLPTAGKMIPTPFTSSNAAAFLLTHHIVCGTILNPGLLCKLCNLFRPCPGYQRSRSIIFGFPTMYLDMFCCSLGFNSGRESGMKI